MTRAGIIAVLGILAMGLLLMFTGLAVTMSLQPAKHVASPAEGQVEVKIRPLNGDSFRATVYYPAVAPGGGAAPLDYSGTPYPAIVFGSDRLATPARYEESLHRLAIQGYVVIAPDTRQMLFPDQSQSADDMLAALAWLAAQGEQEGTLFSGAIRADAFGAAGHATGGGAALLAAARDPRIVAVSTFAADVQPSSSDIVHRIRRPAQFICGSDDEITPLRSRQRPLFRTAAGTRQLVVLKGGSHYGFLDEAPPFDDSGRLPREQQLGLTRSLMATWFALHLKGDETQRASASSPSPDPRVSVTTVTAAD